MNRLTGKVAVVTGAARGIGRACAIRLAAEGATVAVLDRLDDEGAEVVQGIATAGGTARLWRVDVTSEDEIETAMNDVARVFGRIDVLVNNAGLPGTASPTHEITRESWERLMAVNVTGVFLCTKHVLRHMMAARRGSIVNVSSVHGIVGGTGSPPYNASKGAVRLMTKTDALLYARHGIRVNSVHPGYVWTTLVKRVVAVASDPAAMKAELEGKHPLGRLGTPDDVAWGVVYLASDESQFVTGSELVIDGGYSAQ